MKNLVLGILLAGALVLGALGLQQSRKAAQTEAGAAALRQKIGELQSSLEEREKETKRVRDELEGSRADVAAKSREAARMRASLQASLTNRAASAAKPSGQTNGKPASLLSDMFKNPAMKDLIKNQQKTTLGPLIDKNYGKLFSDLRLTPDLSSALKDLLLKKQLAAADIGMALLSDNQDAASRADLGLQVKASNDAADAQIKAFLGDDNYAQFQDYEKSLGERMAVSGFKDQLGSGPSALTADQEQQLIQAMTQERQGFTFTTDLSDKSKFTGDFTAMFTEEKMNSYFQEAAQLNQQYVARAQTILSPDQLTAFQQYFDNQQALQKSGMQMAAKMFAPAKAAGN